VKEEKFCESPAIMQQRWKSRGGASKEEKEILKYGKHHSKQRGHGFEQRLRGKIQTREA